MAALYWAAVAFARRFKVHRGIPKTADDIILEGKQMHHCVGSYVGRVASGNTIIAFARYADSRHKSQVTIEIVNNKIVQKRTFGDKRPSTEWTEFIGKWASAKKLQIGH